MIPTGSPHLPSPPRQLRRRKGQLGNNIGCAMAAMTPFILVGIGLILAVPVRFYILSHGAQVAVIVDGKDIATGTKNGETYHHYYVKFHYLFNDQVHQDQLLVPLEQYQWARPGKPESGRVVQIGSWTICISTLGDVAGDTKSYINTAIVWNLFFGLILSFMWIPGVRQKRLVRDGIQAAGTVVDHKVIAGKSTSYSITFTFKSSDGVEWKNKQGVSKNAYEVAAIGSPVTVLYDPGKPSRSVAYEYCNFEVVPMVG